MVFAVHCLESKTVALIQLSWIKEKVVNIFHLLIVNFLLSPMVGSLSQLINCQRWNNVISQIDVAAFLQFLKVPSDRFIHLFDTVHHDHYSNIIRI